MLPVLLIGALVGAGLASMGWLFLDSMSPPTPPGPIILPTGTAEVVLGNPIRVITHHDTVQFTLPDGASVFLVRNSELELTRLADAGGGTDTVLTLLRGRVLVSVDLKPGYSFRLRAANGVQARVVGSIMGMEYDPNTNRAWVDCLEGHCAVGNEGAEDETWLEGGQNARLEVGGTPVVGLGSNNEVWATQISLSEATATPAVPTDTPSPTETATPDVTATRAAFCATRSAQFPGTPCPP